MRARVDPWERQPTESAQAYEAFAAYRDLGVTRSAARVGQQLGKSKTLMDRWSSAHAWVRRVEAWGRDQERLWRKEQQQARRDAAHRHARLASAFQAKVVSRLQSLDPTLLSAGELLRWLDVTVRIERQVYDMDAATEATAAGGASAPGLDLAGVSDEERRARLDQLRRELNSRLSGGDT